MIFHNTWDFFVSSKLYCCDVFCHVSHTMQLFTHVDAAFQNLMLTMWQVYGTSNVIKNVGDDDTEMHLIYSKKDCLQTGRCTTLTTARPRLLLLLISDKITWCCRLLSSSWTAFITVQCTYSAKQCKARYCHRKLSVRLSVCLQRWHTDSYTWKAVTLILA